MSFRTLVAIVITIGLTVLIIQNTDEATFSILFFPVSVSKLAVLTATSVGGFLLGILVSWPRRPKYSSQNDTYPNDESRGNGRSNTLSDEDRDYIS